jgi:hypothetical protein
MVVSECGDSPEEAMTKCYKKVDTVKIPNMRYRGDLTEAIAEVYSRIIDTGWLSDGNNGGRGFAGVFGISGRKRNG